MFRLNRRDTSLVLLGAALGAMGLTLAFACLTGWNTTAERVNAATILKLAHTLDTSHPVHLALERMGRRLEELSAGRLQVLIAPNGQLGSEVECIELLQNGALAMAKTSTAPLEGFVPRMAIFGVPYLFQDERHFWRVIGGPIGRELLADGTPKGLVGLCWYDAGARSFYTRSAAIESPQDLDGLKIRVQNSAMALSTVTALGASPTPLSFGELYTGLQQGLVDGAENNPPSFYSSRHFEVCKEYSLDEHTRVPDVLLFSLRWWDRLDEQQKQWVRQAAKESSEWQREAWRSRTREALDEVKAAGVTVRLVDRQEFVDRVAALHRSLEGTAIGDLMSQIRSAE